MKTANVCARHLWQYTPGLTIDYCVLCYRSRPHVDGFKGFTEDESRTVIKAPKPDPEKDAKELDYIRKRASALGYRLVAKPKMKPVGVLAKYPKHMSRWSSGDINSLAEGYKEGASLLTLSGFYQRKPSAILGRLVTMKLIHYEGTGWYDSQTKQLYISYYQSKKIEAK